VRHSSLRPSPGYVASARAKTDLGSKIGNASKAMAFIEADLQAAAASAPAALITNPRRVIPSIAISTLFYLGESELFP
jgi:hypothetical protein